MTVREHLDQVVTELSEARLSELVDFARFLRSLDARQGQEKEEWRAFGNAQFAKAYGPNEPDYTEADLKVRTRADSYRFAAEIR